MIDYAEINQKLYEGKSKVVQEMIEEALAEGIPVEEVLEKGLISGMSVVGEDFKHNRLYVPQVLVAARAMKTGLIPIKPLLEASDNNKPTGVLVMGTVKGDLHDIGKNLVCMMAEGAGYKIIDMGVDQKVDDYLNVAKDNNADIVGMSALLTTTMPYMKVVIDAFREEGLGHVKLCVGGAPVSQMFADDIGADGYGSDASSSVELFNEIMKAKEQGACA